MLKMTPLKNVLRRERRRAGLTQAELAEKSGVSLPTIARIEAGYIEAPRVSTLRKLARGLGLEVRDLLEDD
jgi:transcriptional regulator with XRE-family HTH domain